ncbi:MAG: EAL domain-containing protein [Proteobacteria bacterium]|nr:EAL domain-containing protein [Pseudomonadota bacterium]
MWVKFVGAAVSICAALVAPAIYATIMHVREHDALAFKASLSAGRVAKYIYAHGPMWQYQSVRLAELIEFGDGAPLAQRVFTLAGRPVTQVGEEPMAPRLAHIAPIVVGGQTVGRIEVAVSARPMLAKTLAVGAGSATLSALAYFLLAWLRLRTLRRTVATLDERERELAAKNLQIGAALENMPQGLCMFDAEQRLVICNSMYARMYGLAPELTKPGTPLSAILTDRLTSGHGPKKSEGFVENALASVAENASFVGERDLVDGRIILMARHPTSDGGFVALHMDVTEKREAERKLAHLAFFDTLTGLANRRLLREHLAEEMSMQSDGKDVAVLCLDLDGFKAINDTLGHAAGDALLCAVADRMRECLHDVELVARTGGDEFSIVQSGEAQPQSAAALARRILTAMELPFDLDGSEVLTGTSIGIAIGPADAADPDVLVRNADIALHRAKADGRSLYRFFEAGMDLLVQAKRMLEHDLRKAIATGEFELHYQPVVNLKDNSISGFEALLRWRHPLRGLVSPAEFIPTAEKTGLIVPIGEWVIREACAQAVCWPAHLRVAVNVSPVQFRSENLVPATMAAVVAAGLAPDRLELEITEAVLLQDNEATLAILHQMRGLGLRISMDDFGTGYSSLSYLHSFPFDKIKIDQSFVHHLEQRPDSIAIIRAVVGLGESFGMVTTVEGVETQDQLDQMRKVGCNEAQGFVFSKPRPAGEIAEFLAAFEQKAQAAA